MTTAAITLWCISRTRYAQVSDGAYEADPVTLMFEGTTLIQATAPAIAMFGLEPGMHEWDDLNGALDGRFPDFPASLYPHRSGSLVLKAKNTAGPSQARIKWEAGQCRVTFLTGNNTDLSGAEKDELAALRRVSDTSVNAVWQTHGTGDVVWSNAAYASLTSLLADAGKADVLSDIADQELPTRVEVKTLGTDKADWYQVDGLALDGFKIYTAQCVTPVREAEVAQRNFVQTLTKTFAHLHTALAIFDRRGQLALFNPALVDLTGLSGQFLSARPTILSFFDALRENRRMPEPKNYLSWRQEIAELIAAASDGRYSETWSLESGQTYSVQGRPHPDGATAFIIEDVSAEVTLTRNFRAELELSQSLLDTIPDAMAVFSPSGLLTFCNQAYKDLWGVNPDSTFVDVNVADSVAMWRQQTAPNARWSEIETSVLTYGNRNEWNMPLVLSSGTEVTCEVIPIAAAATLIRFSPLAQPTTPEAPQLLPAI